MSLTYLHSVAERAVDTKQGSTYRVDHGMEKYEQPEYWRRMREDAEQMSADRRANCAALGLGPHASDREIDAHYRKHVEAHEAGKATAAAPAAAAELEKMKEAHSALASNQHAMRSEIMARFSGLGTMFAPTGGGSRPARR